MIRELFEDTDLTMSAALSILLSTPQGSGELETLRNDVNALRSVLHRFLLSHVTTIEQLNVIAGSERFRDNKLRTIIAGSRTCTKPKFLVEAVKECGFEIGVVISGTANGADKLGETWAKRKGLPVEKFPADWVKNGKGAGYVRNAEMAGKAEALIALWDGVSPGTKSMIALAKRKGLRVFVKNIPHIKG